MSATIYPRSSGSVSTQTVSLGTLDGCPLYSGSSPMYLYPGDQPYSPAASSSWALSTVITCGLGLPLGNVTTVQVDNPSHGFESPLSNAAISDPGQYRDAAAPNALPVISVDGTENQSTYVRPWLGGSDHNAADEVIADGGPITIVAYENGPPLSVSVRLQTISRTATSMTVRLSATVRNPDGTIVQPSALTWSWNFADGTTSTAARPRHSFAPGVYPVTVQVTDSSAGTGGTTTTQLSFSPSSRSGSANHSGAGRSRKVRPPSGPVHGRGNRPGGTPGAATGGATTPPTTRGPGAASSSPAAAAASSATHSSGPSASSTHSSHRPAAARVSRRGRRATAPAHVTTPAAPNGVIAPGAPVVVGRLISDVTPLPMDVSPLSRSVSAALAGAPAVRGATRASVLPIVGAALGVLLLFGLGAARELGFGGGSR